MKKDNVALTPPMGWNSWDCYGTTVTEDVLLENAKYMKENLKDYGWEYIVCDIQWSEPEAGKDGWDYRPFATLCLDDFGRQIPAVNRFPSSSDGRGFSVIADKIHEMGLKFGIHIMRGVPRLAVHKKMPVMGTNISCDKIAHSNSICKWNSDMYGIDYNKEGAQEYYDSIFKLYANWGVDFVKVDDICNTNAYPDDPYSAEKEIEMIRKAIDSCGRDMVLSLSPGPAVIEKAWHLRQNANMWRITDDFWDDWELLKAMFERCEVWQRQVSPGCWPDCDMLPIGKLRVSLDPKGETSRFTKDEIITMMTLWCIFRSPLIMGGDMRKNDKFALSIMRKKELLRLTTNSHDARQVRRNEDEAIWMSFDDDGSIYAALFNLSEKSKDVAVGFDQLEIEGVHKIRDIWNEKDVGETGSGIKAKLNPHGAALFKITG